MNADEIVKALRENAEWCDANEYGVPLCMGDNQRAAADLIESLQAQLNDTVPVVRCSECIWWQDRQVQLIDGSCRDYMPDEPWSVTCDVGINVGSHCTKHGFDDESGSWFWAAANDYCSRGEKEGTMTK